MVKKFYNNFFHTLRLIFISAIPLILFIGIPVRENHRKIIFPFWLAALLIWFSFGLIGTAFASQEKIRSIRESENINKIKSSFINIEKDLQQSLDEVKISNKINGELGSIIKSKKRLKKEKTQVEQKRLNVIFELSSDIIDFNKLISRGIIIKNQHKNLLEVEVSLQDIENIVEEFDEILHARLPKRFFPLEVISEGVNLSGASTFHDNGYTGQGVKVAVIDVGFKGLSDAQANNDLPSNVTTQDYTGEGLQTQYLHGTACAEIVYDMAPDAELHLLKVSDEMDSYNALDYCITNNIDIITASIGTFGSGPGDGTGPICEAFEEARENGILVVAAAGNSASYTISGTHWKGAFYDSDADDIHEFIPSDVESWYNAIAAIPSQDDDGNPETNDVTVIMRWDDWPDANIDYDIYLFDYFTAVLVASSTTTQNGSQPPLEAIVVDLPDDEDYWHYYALVVTRKSGEPAGTELELSLGGTSLFIPFYKYALPIVTSSSTIGEPADAQNVFAVGAIDQANWRTGPQEEFSSQGPTNAWAGSAARIKPDICGPDGVSGYTYGTTSFYGTSAATPCVAGAATLFLSENLGRTADELQTLLESRAVDMGVSGKDNIYGWGRLNMLEGGEYEDDGDNGDGGDGFGGNGYDAGNGYSSEGGNGGGGRSNCFIATACFGTPMAEEVRVLSKFRDECLLTNPVGKVFVNVYYKISPPIADFIRKHPVLKSIVRGILQPLVWLSQKAERSKN